jgi:hypothetical protein
MDLQTLKETVGRAGFSEEGLALMNAILDKAIGRGVMEKAEKEEMLGIMGVEIEAAKLEADTKKQIAAALNEFADSVDNIIDKTVDELEALEKDEPAVPKP